MGAGHEASNLYKVIVLFTLFATFTYTIFTRYLIVWLYSVPINDLTPDKAKWESIKEAFGLSATQYTLLTGPAFAATFAVFNSLSGYLADNFNRKIIMLMGLLLNVAAILGIKYAQSFVHLLLLRGLLALAQSCFAPISYSLINGYFSTKKTTASSLFATGVYSGYGLSTLTLHVLPIWGWRNTALYIALAGAAFFGMVTLFVFEPPRNQMTPEEKEKSRQAESEAILNATEDPEDIARAKAAVQTPPPPALSWFASIKAVFSSTHIWGIIFILTLRLAAGGVLGAFFPVLAKRRWPEHKDTFATLNCLCVSIGGIVSGFIGGSIVDFWIAYVKKKQEDEAHVALLDQESSDSYGATTTNPYDMLSTNATPNGAITMVNGVPLGENNELVAAQEKKASSPLRPFLFVAAASCLTCTIPFYLTFRFDNLYMSMGMLFVSYLISECYFGPLLTFIHSTPQLTPNVRSTAVAVTLGIAQMVSSLAPVLVGYIDDHYDFHLMNELSIGFLVPAGVAGFLALFVGIMIK